MRLGEYDKYDEMSDDWRVNVVRIILEKMSDIYVGEFGVFHLPAIYTHEILCVDPS